MLDLCNINRDGTNANFTKETPLSPFLGLSVSGLNPKWPVTTARKLCLMETSLHVLTPCRILNPQSLPIAPE